MNVIHKLHHSKYKYSIGQSQRQIKIRTVILWHHNNNNDVWKYFLGNLTEERGGVSNFFGLLDEPVYSLEILGINKEMKDGNSCGCCHLILFVNSLMFNKIIVTFAACWAMEIRLLEIKAWTYSPMINLRFLVCRILLFCTKA